MYKSRIFLYIFTTYLWTKILFFFNFSQIKKNIFGNSISSILRKFLNKIFLINAFIFFYNLLFFQNFLWKKSINLNLIENTLQGPKKNYKRGFLKDLQCHKHGYLGETIFKDPKNYKYPFLGIFFRDPHKTISVVVLNNIQRGTSGL